MQCGSVNWKQFSRRKKPKIQMQSHQYPPGDRDELTANPNQPSVDFDDPSVLSFHSVESSGYDNKSKVLSWVYM